MEPADNRHKGAAAAEKQAKALAVAPVVAAAGEAVAAAEGAAGALALAGGGAQAAVASTSSTMTAAGSFGARAELVGELSPRLLDACRAAVSRCVAFTGGGQALGLLEALGLVLGKFAGRVASLVEGRLRPLAGLDALGPEAALAASKAKKQRGRHAKAAAAAGAGASGAVPGGAAGAAAAGDDGAAGGVAGDGDGSLAGGSLSVEVQWDWALLHAAMGLLEASGAWQRGLLKLEADAAHGLRGLYPLLFPAAGASGRGGGGTAQGGGGADKGLLPACWPPAASSSSSAAGGEGGGSGARGWGGGGGAVLEAYRQLCAAANTVGSGVGGGGERGDGDDVGSYDGGGGGSGGGASDPAGGCQHLSIHLARDFVASQPPAFGHDLKALLFGLSAASSSSASSLSSSSSSSSSSSLAAASAAAVGLTSTPAEVAAASGALACGSGGMPGAALLAGPMKEALALSGACRTVVFDLCLRPVKEALAPLATLGVWAGQAEREHSAHAAYSTQPSAHMTVVGEHLLSLYQELELFAHSSGRDDAEVATLGGGPGFPMAGAMGGGAATLASGDWRKLARLLPLTDAETAALPTALALGKRPPGLRIDPANPSAAAGGDDDNEDDEEEEEEEGGDEEAASVARFCSAWLAAVARSIVAQLLFGVLSVPKLDARGLGQLAADLDYLLNVFAALGI